MDREAAVPARGRVREDMEVVSPDRCSEFAGRIRCRFKWLHWTEGAVGHPGLVWSYGKSAEEDTLLLPVLPSVLVEGWCLDEVRETDIVTANFFTLGRFRRLPRILEFGGEAQM